MHDASCKSLFLIEIISSRTQNVESVTISNQYIVDSHAESNMGTARYV